MFLPEIEAICAALEAGGLSATWDPRNAHPPCAIVVPRENEPATAHRVRLTIDIILIAPGIGHGDAIAWLSQALELAWQALPVRWPGSLTVWRSPHTGTDLLAWTMTRQETIDYQHS